MEEVSGMTSEKANDNTSAPKIPIKRGRLVSIIIIAALFLIGIVQTLTGSTGVVSTEINDEYLGVSGTYGDPVFLKLDTISDVQLVDTFDFGTCIDGEETGNTVSGTYSCEEYDEYIAHAYINKPCIIVHSPSGVLVFNCGSASNTEKMYDQLTAAADTVK